MTSTRYFRTPRTSPDRPGQLLTLRVVKFLRLSQTLLPPGQVRKGIWGSAMTLSAGQHDFPFELKVGFTSLA